MFPQQIIFTHDSWGCLRMTELRFNATHIGGFGALNCQCTTKDYEQ